MSVLKFPSRDVCGLLVVICVLSGFTHLYNTVGFPAGPSNDEGIYMRRAMHVLTGQGPQEGTLYDHPYFGQLFLAATLGLIGYPYSLSASSDSAHSAEMLYLVPRILMGILAIIDTLLIYKITNLRYGKRVAFLASILFAVMPLTWIVRRMWLEPLQLPFLLSSILFAMNIKNTYVGGSENYFINRKSLMILFSGLLLGLSIFTKIPVFAMVPLIGYIVYKNSRSLSLLGLWFVPVVLIPLIWPIYAIHVGQFNSWLDGVFWQTHRGVSNTFIDSIKYDISIDPVLIILGISGLAFAAIKRDIFLLLWLAPFLIFLYLIGFVSYWHIVPLLPAFCVAAARLIEFLPNIASIKKIYQKLTIYIIIAAVGVFGLINTILLIIPINLNSAYFEAANFIIQYLRSNNSNDITVISNPFYTWIPQSVLQLDHNYIDYYNGDISVKTHKVLLIVDPALIYILRNHEAADQIQKNFNLYTTNRIATFVGGANKYDKVSVYLYESNPNRKTN